MNKKSVFTIELNKGGVMKALLAIPVVGVVLFFGLWAGLLAMTIYGLYLAFSASIVLGIIALIVEPSPLIFGLVMFFFSKNLPEMILAFLSK